MTDLQPHQPPAPGALASTTAPNRQDSPVLPPGLTDEEIVTRWLRLKAAGRGALSKTTQAQYRTEAERLFWYARRIDTPISSWTVDHLVDFLAFLQQPAPWAIRAPGVRRGSPTWRPFLGPLGDASAAQTQKIVTSLFAWLRDIGYLRVNPAAGVPSIGRAAGANQARFLSVEDCALMREAISARTSDTEEDRLRQARDAFLVDLFAITGLRTSEAVNTHMRDFQMVPVPSALRREDPTLPEYTWLLQVRHGKGGKPRVVPCAAIIPALQLYRLAFGLPAVPLPDESGWLILSVRRTQFGERKPLRSRVAVWKIITGICAEACEFAKTWDRTVDAQRLEHASTHWLRHTYAKGLVKANVSERHKLDNMGHADRRTFDQYDDDEVIRRVLATDRARRPGGAQ